VEKRRPAGYFITDTRHNTNRFVSLELAERIRTRVMEWKAAEYPGITSVTRRLMEHWHDRSQARQSILFLPVGSH
jgi:type III restriction enzyme